MRGHRHAGVVSALMAAYAPGTVVGFVGQVAHRSSSASWRRNQQHALPNSRKTTSPATAFSARRRLVHEEDYCRRFDGRTQRRRPRSGAAIPAAPDALASTSGGVGAAPTPAAAAGERDTDDARAGVGATQSFADELGVLDEEQAAMMGEQCILVDRHDRPTGSASKGRVLMQRRADSKHTFASYWTNTCCSHPLWNDSEMGTDLTTPRGQKAASEGDAAVTGATRAAVRKLGQELGIPSQQLPLEDFTFLTKVHYKASSGSTWGEHEIDYVFLIQADVDLHPNPNEVSNTAFLDRDGLRSLLASASRGEVEFTPWSAYIIDRFVFDWWDHVGDKGKLSMFRDDVIHRVGSCADAPDEDHAAGIRVPASAGSAASSVRRPEGVL